MNRIKRPSPAMIVACLALFVALGTAAYAGVKLPANSVGPRQLKTDGVTANDMAPGSVGTEQVANGAITSGAIAPASVTGQGLAGGAVSTGKLAPQPNARVSRTADQSIVGNALVPVQWNVEAFDSQTMHDNATNNDRLTAPVTGIYDLSTNLEWAADADGFRTILILKNNSIVLAHEEHAPANGATTSPASLHATAELQAGDHVEVVVKQLSDNVTPTNPLNIVRSGDTVPYFSMSYASPAQ